MKHENMILSFFAFLIVLLPLVSCSTTASKDGVKVPEDSKKYELSSIINSLMIDKSDIYHFRDYLYFKSFMKDIRYMALRDLEIPSPEYFPDNPMAYTSVYAGKMPLYVNGKRFLLENMEDKYLWRVYIAGPKLHVSKMYITSQNTVSPDLSGGPQYFRDAGFRLELLECSKDSNANYGASYKAFLPNKHQIILEIGKSSGSGGTWYSYKVSWEDSKSPSLNKREKISFCDISD